MSSDVRRTIVFLNGSLCDERLYSPQIKYFTKSSRILVPNLQQANSIEDMAQLVLAQAPSEFALVGLSMGGIVAMEIMQQAPEKIKALALLDTNPWVNTEKELHARNVQLQDVQSNGLAALEQIVAGVYPRYVSSQNLQDEGLRLLVMDMALKAGVSTFVNQWSALNKRRDYGIALKEVNCPTLIMCGEDDSVCPVDKHRKMAEVIDNAQLEIIPNCGHLCTLEAADNVNLALQNLFHRASLYKRSGE